MKTNPYIFAVFLVAGALISIAPVLAQASESICDIPTITTHFSERIGDAADLETLQEVHSDLASALAACNQLTFSGTKGEVVGPIEVPAGVYILKIANAIVEFQTLDGDCDDPFMSTMLNDDEDIFNSEGCLTLIDVDLQDGDAWAMEFELVRAAD